MIGSLAVGDVTEPVRTPAASSSSSWKRSAAAARWSVTKCMSAISCSSPAKSAAKRRPKLAQKLYERIQSGEDFGELAKSFSEDPGSALNGGDLNWIDPEALVPEFRQVMNDTRRASCQAVPLAVRLAHPAGPRPSRHRQQREFREQRAVSVLRNHQYDEELQAWLRQIRDEAYVEIKQ